MVQISDIHYDHLPIRIQDAFLDRVIEKVNALKPDIIVITGDFVQREPEPIHQLIDKHLNRLKAKYGIYNILGNHDYKTSHGAELITKAFEKTDMTLLHNQVAYPMGKGKGRIQLVGLGDYSRKRVNFLVDQVKESLEEPNRPRIVLSHNPDSAKDLVEFEIDLQLSGHTHGGQVCFPNGRPILPILDKLMTRILPKRELVRISYPRKVVKNWEWARGHHILEQETRPERPFNLYVNRGLATHPPLRLFCDPEITLILLSPK
ncbi:hypothetical protein DFA_11879 [Cavenderia fasciculata]|uniref:Calcineurin-like phosphoesterase domain-containing protein n=1 Tax=Cavenderia fasciculata TaxID=261658 RepID=F4QEK4_CACFS|nr:uncharacterized protein DFA_11879 [Cavenderia fasciculata]EGG14115.1 hypothetical protein DFA_11879 [Cavenderia fasciculata]|eukprot:XP_004350823.1 hypothetical protein DFA_11879 [Cavenderia fasciculata]